MLDTKELLGNGSIGSISKGIISCYARFICAMKLQGIVELLWKCWAFSVDIDMARYIAIGYCDIRIRICYKSAIFGLHLLTILVHDRHTGESIFNTFAKAMNALYSEGAKNLSHRRRKVRRQ